MSKYGLISRCAIVAGLLLPYSNHANAVEPGQWQCLSSVDELFDIQISDLGVRVNNISVTETQNFMTGDGLTISASAANRADDKRHVYIEAVGLLNSEPAFAISATPSFGMVSAGKSDTISETVPRQPGALQSIDKFCIRIDITK